MTSQFTRPTWVEERPYQTHAVEQWIDSGAQGILKMATGTGKTITSLLAAERVSRAFEGEISLVVAVPYQHLVEQWAEDVRDFGAEPILAYKSRNNWQEQLQQQVLAFNTGARGTLSVITTHNTFATDAFQAELGRISKENQMLIADEVHHLGAPHLKSALPEQIPMRLGLSATPQRWYDDEGTDALHQYFTGGVSYEYSLSEAIENGALCEYYYIPHIVELTDEEALEYEELSAKIGRLASRMDDDLGDADIQSNHKLKHALFKRARLLGTAEGKLERLSELIPEQGDIHHTLVYCGDGSVEGESSGRTKRHVDATVELLRAELGVRARRFTAEENQDERERLLAEFERGDLDALVAIRCLDEGVDVPATETAYILASSSNPRQFVQRRGRILRPHENKEFAVVHDFVVSPPERLASGDGPVFASERSLVRKELERVMMFAESARNHPDADVDGIPTSDANLQELKRRFQLLDI